MRRGMIGAAVLVALVGAGAAGWTLIEGEATPATAQQNTRPPPGIPVTAGTVAARDVPLFLNGIGTVQAYNTVTIRSRVDGQIVKVDFAEGQEVKAGTPLFQIDPRPYQAALEQAQAAKQKDQAQLVSAQQDLDRYSKLVGSGFQTRQSFDQQKALVGQVQAAIKGDQAQIDAATLNLGYADIRSPIDGRLGARLVDIGNLVHASDSTALVTITQIKPIFVSFTLPQEDLDQVREAQANAPLVVRAYDGANKKQLAEGKLSLIDNMIDATTGTIHLKADFTNQQERLWPGAFVNVRLVLTVRHNVATVPSQAVQDGADGRYVYRIKPDNTVARQVVDVADVQDGIAVVTKGLAPGDRIVVSGQYRLTDGARVTIAPPQKSQTPADG